MRHDTSSIVVQVEVSGSPAVVIVVVRLSSAHGAKQRHTPLPHTTRILRSEQNIVGDSKPVPLQRGQQRQSRVVRGRPGCQVRVDQ